MDAVKDKIIDDLVVKLCIPCHELTQKVKLLGGENSFSYHSQQLHQLLCILLYKVPLLRESAINIR